MRWLGYLGLTALDWQRQQGGKPYHHLCTDVHRSLLRLNGKEALIGLLHISHYTIYIGNYYAKPLANLKFFQNSCKLLCGKELRRRWGAGPALSRLVAMTYVKTIARKENTSHPHNTATSAIAATTISHLPPSCFITVGPATIDQFLYSLAVGYCGIFQPLELVAFT